MTSRSTPNVSAQPPVRVSRSPRPRDAATLILVRNPQGAGPEVLMGRRRTRDAWSDLYVFPGGRVDRGDHRIVSASELNREVLARLKRSATAPRSRALAIAAIRETFEETGIRIASPLDGRSDRLRQAGDPSWSSFSAEGNWAPALDRLHFLCRAVTPPKRPKRFNARFFVADADTVEEAPRSSGELGDVRWFPLAETPELPLPLITQAVLRVLGDRLSAGSLHTPSKTPLFQTKGSTHLRLFE